MINNFFLQDQINIALVQTNVLLSLSIRFRIKKHVVIIHDSIHLDAFSNYEGYLVINAITLALKHNRKDQKINITHFLTE